MNFLYFVSPFFPFKTGKQSIDFAGENLFRDSVISLYLANTLLFRQMLFSFVFSFHIWGSFSEYFFSLYTYPCLISLLYSFSRDLSASILYECKLLQRFSHFLSFSFYSLLNIMNYVRVLYLFS